MTDFQAGVLVAGTGGYLLLQGGASAQAVVTRPRVRERLAHAGHGRFSH